MASLIALKELDQVVTCRKEMKVTTATGPIPDDQSFSLVFHPRFHLAVLHNIKHRSTTLLGYKDVCMTLDRLYYAIRV